MSVRDRRPPRTSCSAAPRDFATTRHSRHKDIIDDMDVAPTFSQDDQDNCVGSDPAKRLTEQPQSQKSVDTLQTLSSKFRKIPIEI